MINICEEEFCKNEAKNQCSQCKKAFYCSRICQKQDWSNHKLICSTKKELIHEKIEEGKEGISKLDTHEHFDCWKSIKNPITEEIIGIVDTLGQWLFYLYGK